jgi:lysophospholipase L1-like esterase
MIARPTIAGSAVRIKIGNTFSTKSLIIGAASIALRNYQSSLVAGSQQPLTFNGLASVTIPPRGWVRSDPVTFRVRAQQDLAISLYVPGTNVPISYHSASFTTSYLTPNGAGNHVANQDRSAFTLETTDTYWLSAVEVFSSSATGAIIAFGDSITDGTCSTIDAHDRWEDVLATRLLLQPGSGKAVVNAGIGGGNLTQGKRRLTRDVLEQAGATHVILFLGSNDINQGASAAQVIADQQAIIDRVRDAGLQIIGVTILPRRRWGDVKRTIRHQVNDWILSQAGFDAVFDFDDVVRDPDNPHRMAPEFDCDGIHPNPAGYFAMGRSIALEQLLEP